MSKLQYEIEEIIEESKLYQGFQCADFVIRAGLKKRLSKAMSDYIEKIAKFSIPEANEYGSPKSKMPNCFNCGEDELSMLTANSIFCNACCLSIQIPKPYPKLKG